MKTPVVGILTISDRCYKGERLDESGPAMSKMIRAQGWKVEGEDLVPDVLNRIKEKLVMWTDIRGFDLILTTGGTGFSPRDVTPEATLGVIDRLAPGLAEGMRAQSLKVTPHAMLSRAVAGIRFSTLIINLPGSPRAVVENLNFIMPVLPHALELLANDPASEAGHSLEVIQPIS